MPDNAEGKVEPAFDQPITPTAELYAVDGGRPASIVDFERLSGHLPYDDEG